MNTYREIEREPMIKAKKGAFLAPIHMKNRWYTSFPPSSIEDSVNMSFLMSLIIIATIV